MKTLSIQEESLYFLQISYNSLPLLLDGESVLLMGLPLFSPSPRWSGRIPCDTEQAVRPSISAQDCPIPSDCVPSKEKTAENQWMHEIKLMAHQDLPIHMVNFRSILLIYGLRGERSKRCHRCLSFSCGSEGIFLIGDSKHLVIFQEI